MCKLPQRNTSSRKDFLTGCGDSLAVDSVWSGNYAGSNPAILTNLLSVCCDSLVIDSAWNRAAYLLLRLGRGFESLHADHLYQLYNEQSIRSLLIFCFGNVNAQFNGQNAGYTTGDAGFESLLLTSSRRFLFIYSVNNSTPSIC